MDSQKWGISATPTKTALPQTITVQCSPRTWFPREIVKSIRTEPTQCSAVSVLDLKADTQERSFTLLNLSATQRTKRAFGHLTKILFYQLFMLFPYHVDIFLRNDFFSPIHSWSYIIYNIDHSRILRCRFQEILELSVTNFVLGTF